MLHTGTGTHIRHLICSRNYLRCFCSSNWGDDICVQCVVDRRSRCAGRNNWSIEICALCKCTIILLLTHHHITVKRVQQKEYTNKDTWFYSKKT